VGKVVKIFLFFSDLAGYYVRFWLIFNHGLTQIHTDFVLPAGADLAAAFSIPVSAKPAASVRWAIGDGPHKNMQAGKRRILY